MICPLILSAPFGNYVSIKGATSTLGTFTVNNRGGLLYRLWRCLRTLRYNWRIKGFTNKLGLPNSGLISIKNTDCDGKIISIFGFNKDEWTVLSNIITNHFGHHPIAKVFDLSRMPCAIELNLSCPNVNHKQIIDDVLPCIDRLQGTNAVIGMKLPVIAKLPPCRWFDLAIPLYENGVKIFHACNTIATPGGGISGKPLKQFSLWCVEELKQKWGNDITVIGGGGITDIRDIDDYYKAGADHVALGSMLLNPLNLLKVKSLIKYATNRPHLYKPQNEELA